MVLFVSRIKYRLVTAVAEYEFLPFFNPDNRDEKDTQVVVHPLAPGLGQAADRAKAGGLIDDRCLW